MFLVGPLVDIHHSTESQGLIQSSRGNVKVFGVNTAAAGLMKYTVKHAHGETIVHLVSKV